VTIRLYMDEDSMDEDMVRALRARRLDVLTAFEASMLHRSDDEHLDYATTQGRVVCTFNVADFYRLHREYLRAGKTHTGMILVPQQRYTPGE